MAPIQPILIVLVVTIGGLYLTMHRSRLVFQLANIALVALGVTFIAVPDLTNRVAHSVGVGRGADLLLYLLYVATAGAFLQLYRRNRAVDAKLTEVVRQVALRGAHAPHSEP